MRLIKLQSQFIFLKDNFSFVVFHVFKNNLYALASFLENIFYYYPKGNLIVKKLPPEKIVIFLYQSLGDIAVASSFTQFLKTKFPRSQITFITSPGGAYIASLDPNIDQIIPVKLKRFRWTFFNIEKIKNSLNYDIFLNASLTPNLHYLIPFFTAIEVPFFLFRQRPFKLPTPKLIVEYQCMTRQKYFVINFEAETFGSHPNMLTGLATENLKREIALRHPETKFYINQSTFGHKNTVFLKNTRLFAGSLPKLLKLMLGAAGVISYRTGMCDILAAASTVRQFIIYPETNTYWNQTIDPQMATLFNLGYKAKIYEAIINKHEPETITKTLVAIDRFIKSNKLNK